MSIHISRTKNGTTMRLTGDAAQALFDVFAGNTKPQIGAESQPCSLYVPKPEKAKAEEVAK